MFLKRLKVLTGGYLAFWSLLMGAATAAYLDAVNWVIEFFWKTVPGWLGVSTSWRPVLVCLSLSLVIGLCQVKLGPYPMTIAQILTEVHQKGYFDYRRWWKILLSALIIMGAGASVGPEASASGLVAGMVYWLCCRYKLIRTQADQLATASLGQQLHAIWAARLAEVPVDRPITDFLPNGKQRKFWYTLWSLVAVVGLAIFFKFFPQEGVFGFHHPAVHWQWGGLLVVIPAMVVGWLFGYFFVWLGKWSEQRIDNGKHRFAKVILGGVMMAAGAAFSVDLLLSGEFQISSFATESLTMAPFFLLLLAILKAVVTNVGFALGWRGGTIFPAIFSALAAGAFLAHFLPWMPRLTVTIVMTTALTVILEKPMVTVILLVLLLPVQFTVFMILMSVLTKYVTDKVPALKP